MRLLDQSLGIGTILIVIIVIVIVDIAGAVAFVLLGTNNSASSQTTKNSSSTSSSVAQSSSSTTSTTGSAGKLTITAINATLPPPVYQIQNETNGYVYTGQELEILVTVGDITASPAITISDISVSNPGVTIVSIDLPIPAIIPANGDTKFTIIIMAPAGCDQGNLNFTVTEST